MSDNLPDKKPNGVRDAALALNPALRYLDIEHHGWLCLHVDKRECKAEWHFVESILERNYTSLPAHTLTVRANKVREGLA